MIATKDSIAAAREIQGIPSGDEPPAVESAPHSSDQLPNSARVYAPGVLHKDIRVPMREITLSSTKSFNGQIEVNEPVRVYDTSGPWGDPDFTGNVEAGLPALRRDWILQRDDAREYAGRPVQPID